MSTPRRCEFCDDLLPADARPNRKYCDEDCRRGRVSSSLVLDLVRARDTIPEAGPVLGATDQAITVGKAEKRITALDAGTVAAIRVLARKIDDEQARWDYCFEWAERWSEWARETGDDHGDGPPPAPPKPPPMDNVSIPIYLKYAESLGLTPGGAGRALIGGAKEPDGGGSKLGGLVGSVPRPTAG